MGNISPAGIISWHLLLLDSSGWGKYFWTDDTDIQEWERRLREKLEEK